MAYYYPRMHAVLTVPLFGSSRAQAEQAKGADAVTIPVVVRSAHLCLNNHNLADTLDITFEWQDAGIDPRLIKNATIDFWMGDAGPEGSDIVSPENWRFSGIATKVQRSAKGDEGIVIEMSFQDYTCFFIRAKPFPASGIPTYRDTLRSSWSKICDHTGWWQPEEGATDPKRGKIISSVASFKDKLRTVGDIDLDKPFKGFVPSRFEHSPVGRKDTSDGWSIWQNVVGMHGLISYIDRDECIIATTTEHFGAKKTPRLVWGKNIMSIEETASSDLEHKGVAITSYSPTAKRIIEVFYPPFGDPRIAAKRVTAKAKKSSGRGRRPRPPALPTDRYEYYEYNDVVDEDQLLVIAENTYEERSRQEIKGSLKTAEMFVDCVDGSLADVLSLKAGDPIRIEMSEEEKTDLSIIGEQGFQIDYLQRRGYERSVAELIAKNFEAIKTLDTIYHVKTVDIQLSTDDTGGTFDIDIHYWNKIKLSVKGSGETEDA